MIILLTVSIFDVYRKLFMMRSKRNFYISWAKSNNIQFPVPGKQKLMIIEELIIYHFSYTQRGLILTPPASEAFQEVTN